MANSLDMLLSLNKNMIFSHKKLKILALKFVQTENFLNLGILPPIPGSTGNCKIQELS